VVSLHNDNGVYFGEMGSVLASSSNSTIHPVVVNDPDINKMVASIPSGIFIATAPSATNEFSIDSSKDFHYQPNMAPGIVGLHERVTYFAVKPGEFNSQFESTICFVEPALEQFNSPCSPSASGKHLGRQYTPIYLNASTDDSIIHKDNLSRHGSAL
jgi:hypothetical protein